MTSKIKGLGTAEKPWELKTPPGSAEYQAYRDEAASPPALVVQVGKTQLDNAKNNRMRAIGKKT